jgi:hypothetical protein
LGIEESAAHKKKKKSRKSKGLDENETKEEENDESVVDSKKQNGSASLLADVQHAKQFTLASSTNPAKMHASEWPLLLKVGTQYMQMN